MRSIIVLIAAVLLLASCAKLEFEEMTDSSVTHVSDSESNVTMKTEENGWQIYLK